MAEKYLQHDQIPYLFDTKFCKTFRMEGTKLIEISNIKTLQSIRLKSMEITRKDARKLATATFRN
ncbi:MAG: hypothetical protein QNI92_01875 [Desulfobacterales bacterium]|nr:hypothetical protein [Desulfobacterales bacterium]MDJ0913780.1 hypothetical protein [Desulfobacterales bacterium]